MRAVSAGKVQRVHRRDGMEKDSLYRSAKLTDRVCVEESSRELSYADSGFQARDGMRTETRQPE